jgi:hypothetical protein
LDSIHFQVKPKNKIKFLNKKKYLQRNFLRKKKEILKKNKKKLIKYKTKIYEIILDEKNKKKLRYKEDLI